MTESEKIFELLLRNNLKLCCAESFTGGGIASELISLPGASNIFSLGLICYSNEAKMNMLNVKRHTLDTFGAVSSQTISEMLDGLMRLRLGNIFLATSGNAGPTSEKPDEVGMFYIGVMFNGKKIIKKYFSDGNRNQVIKFGITKSFELLEELLHIKLG